MKLSGTIGFETLTTFAKMNFKMLLFVGGLYLSLAVAATVAYSYYKYEEFRYLIEYAYLSIKYLRYPEDPWLILEVFWGLAVKSAGAFVAFALLAWIGFLYTVYHLKRHSERLLADKYLAGAKLITQKELKKEIKKNREEVDIPLSPELHLPKSAEVKHFLVIGRPGVGKTVLLSQGLNRLAERNERVIVHDFKGDYISKFYNPQTDIIFNPLDSRGVKWNVFNEIRTVMDIEAIAASLIPEAHGADNFFNKAARDVLTGIIHYLYQNGQHTNDALYSAVTAPGRQIADWLRDTKGGEAGYVYVQDASSKQALSVFATLISFTSCFKYMSAGNDCDFSITKWIENGQGKIFVSNYADVKDTLKPILSLFVDLAGKRILSLPDDYDRRIFFLLDEFGTLQKLTTIQNLLTLSRSKGGSVWLGIQDVGQLDKIYTPAGRQTIVNAAGNYVAFSVSDPDTAEFLSKKIGDTEISRVQESYVTSPSDYRDSINFARHEKVKRLVLPSDIGNLRDLECYLKIANYDITRTKLQYRSYENKNPAFVLRQGLSVDEIH